MHIKQIGLSFLTFMLAVYITLATAYAQEASSTAAQTPLPAPVSYQLPYPGMLPDNPLYFLKVWRDALTAFFLGKPLDKAEFNLLQSDKNVEASYLLVTQQQGKTTLSLTTFSNAQDDFSQAIEQTSNAKRQGYSTQGIVKRLTASNLKHMQILQAIIQQTGQKDAPIVQQEFNRAKTFTQTLKSL